MKTTLRQLDKGLERIAEAHIQVEDYFWGDWEDAYDMKVRKFPLVVCNVSTPVTFSKITTLELNIIAVNQFDNEGNSNRNLNEVESDMLQILHDFFKTIKYGQNWKDFCAIQVANSNLKFKDGSADKVAGWQTTIVLKLMETMGTCDIPLEDYDFTKPIKC